MSVRVDVLLSLNTLFNPSATKKSLPFVSKIMSDDSKFEFVSSSKTIVSDVTSESSNVPVSCANPPPMAETKPTAVSVSLSEDGLVNVNTSPT